MAIHQSTLDVRQQFKQGLHSRRNSILSSEPRAGEQQMRKVMTDGGGTRFRRTTVGR